MTAQAFPRRSFRTSSTRFFTTKPQGQGTGLGLDIVLRLIQGHDGEVGVESRSGRTEFRVSIPIVDGAPVRGAE